MTNTSLQQETAGTRAMRRDPSFPDAAEDVVSLLTGHVANLKATSELLKKHTEANRHRIDFDMGHFLLDMAGDFLQQIEDLTCAGDCGRLAVHQWFDGKFCDDCSRGLGAQR